LLADQPVATGSTAIGTDHFGVGARVIDEVQLLGIKRGLIGLPALPSLGHVWPVPSGAAFLNNVVIAVPDPPAELIADCSWVLLYIERWLKAPAMLDGTLVPRERGTPQGGVISPLLANLFLHYVCDVWLKRVVPGVPFERYADDIICHCRSEREALTLRQVLDRRFAECGLVLHSEKTKVVYC